MYEELISRLKNLATLTTENGESKILVSAEAVQTIREIATQAADAIEELSKPRWIPVTDRLPIRGDRVICFGDNGINTVDFVCGDKWCVLPWFYLDGEQETGVTHWMPLPEPPKEET